jgi:hypothetical protein
LIPAYGVSPYGYNADGMWCQYFLLLTLLCAATLALLMKYFIRYAELRAMWKHIHVGQFWTIFEVMMAIYGVALVVGFMYFKWSASDHMDWWWPTRGDALYYHPTWIAVFILFKFQQVIQKTLCIRGIGEMVIPAYYALFDKASTRVITFAFMLWLNSLCTYYAIPVELSRSWIENIWLMGVSMYRLDFSGDFDLNTLEGLNENIVLNRTRGGPEVVQGSIQDPSEFMPWHKAVGALYMAFFFFMNVGLLNVYIGIVSELYTRKYNRRKEFFEAYRAVYIYKLLVSRRVKSPWTMSGPKPDQPPGIWFMYDAQSYELEQESKGDTADLQTLKENLQKVMESQKNVMESQKQTKREMEAVMEKLQVEPQVQTTTTLKSGRAVTPTGASSSSGEDPASLKAEIRRLQDEVLRLKRAQAGSSSAAPAGGTAKK